MKSLYSISTAKTEKKKLGKMEKTRLVVWWFDVTNKIHDLNIKNLSCVTQNSMGIKIHSYVN